MLDVLLVEDDEDVRERIASSLEEAGHRVTQAHDGGRAALLIDSRAFDVAVCDVHLPGVDGLTLARRLRRTAPGTAVIVMTSHANVSDVVRSMRDGVIEYVVKPFDADDFATRVIGPIAERRAMRKSLELARAERVNQSLGVRIVAESAGMRVLTEHVAAAAQSDSPVLLHGERGSGKKTLARLVHEKSPRAGGPFLVVPCVTLPGVLLETEQMERSGRATDERDAWFRAAEGGTLVLDGVDALPPSAQSTLARVLAEPEGLASRGVDWAPRGVRVVATAQTDLAARVQAGEVLESLFFRLTAAVARVPPLRERSADLLPLTMDILSALAPSWARPSLIEPAAYTILSSYSFPGNVTELVWALKFALLMADTSPVEAGHLPQRILAAVGSGGAGLPM